MTINFCCAQNYEWAYNVGGSSSDEGISIALDGSDLYVTGTYYNTVDFDPGIGTTNFTSVGSRDIFIQKMDDSGNLLWATSLGGTSIEDENSITTDDSGNVLLTGCFQGTSDVEPGAGTTNFTSGGERDMFVIKLDGSGNFTWAKQIGGTETIVSKDIQTDASGNVYISGYFEQTIDFDPGAGTQNLTSSGSNDAFLLKLDDSGNFVWVKQVGSTSSENFQGFELDASGNIYITGGFNGTVDFDPGAGTANLTAVSGGDIFILKLDASGNFDWVKQISGNSNEQGFRLAIDDSGNLLSIGVFSGTVDFDPGTGTYNLTSNGGSDIYALKLDSNGDFVWARHVGGSNTDTGLSIAVDGIGHVYLTGYFFDNADFDPGAGESTLYSVGSLDVFVWHLNALGDLVWAAQIGSTGLEFGNDIVVDDGGNVYGTGLLSGTADFDPSAGTNNLSPVASQDIFVYKWSESEALPIELIYFEARLMNNQVQLNWQTASETNNDLFTIERSADGLNWDQIMYVDGAGNSSETLQYTAIDKQPLAGTSYYRLRQTDHDGSSEISSVETISFVHNSPIRMWYSGNKLHIQSKSGINGAILFDVNGKKISTHFAPTYNGLTLPTSGLKPGIYLVKILADGRIWTNRFRI